MAWQNLEEDLAELFADERGSFTYADLEWQPNAGTRAPFMSGFVVARARKPRIPRAQKEDLGLCSRCTNPRVVGRKMCFSCAKKNKARVLAYKQNNAKSRKCVTCGQSATGRYCQRHTELHKEHMRRRRERLRLAKCAA
jgi:hypothetical protein